MNAFAIGSAVLAAAAAVAGAAWFMVPNTEDLPAQVRAVITPQQPDVWMGPGAMPRSDGQLTLGDGYIADGQSVLPVDDRHPAIANLDPDLRRAVREAAADAREDGVTVLVTAGWRSERYQQQLLDEAIETYGSEEEARRWVNTPELSTHVSGDAVDIGPTDAMSWLSQHGSDYGLCQTYANEPWHYELATSPGGVCPQQLRDAASGMRVGMAGR